MKLQKKVLVIALPLTAAFALAGALSAKRLTEGAMMIELGERLAHQAEDSAAGLAPALAGRDETMLLARLQSAQAFSGAAYAEALDAQGVVAAHTDVLQKGRRRDTALLPAEASARREGDLLVVSAPVWRGTEEFLLSGWPRQRLGTLRLGVPLAPTRASAARVGGFVALLAVALCATALALALVLTRLLLRAVSQLSTATARVASGDYGARVPAAGADELGELADAFNRMSDALSRTTVSRDRLEEALSIARAAMDSTADGVLVVGADFRLISCNERFREIWRLPAECASDQDVRRWGEFVKPQLEEPELLEHDPSVSPVDPFLAESRLVLRMKDGRVLERISRPFSVAGVPAGRSITVRDMTLHHEGLRALSAARDEALEAARVKSRFLAGVSHELRTPLNAVVGAAGLLGLTRLDAEQREHADTLERASRALIEIIDRILDFSKIEEGRMTVERTHLRLGDLIREAGSLMGPLAAEKGLRLRLDAGEAGDWDLAGDPTRLRQVLVNLLSNAVKFTEQGAVEAAARVVASGESWAELEFSVSDTGIGVAPEHAERIFAPFTQADGSMARRFGGTGLGLAISKSLVDLMGGRIGFESEPGRGSRFWFRLRLERVAAAEAARARSGGLAPAAPRERLRVLVVEDNALNRRLLVRQMQRLGCPVETAEDGGSALGLLREREYGLVLMDCQMPGLDGLETTRRLRAEEGGWRRCPVVAVSANSSPEDRRACREAGMDDFLSKPATLEALAAALDRWDRPYDEEALAHFAAIAGEGPWDLPRLLGDFLAGARGYVEAARAAFAGGDRMACARAAHALKGSAATVGARGLRELARRLERTAAGAEGGDLASLLAQLEAELARAAAVPREPVA